MLGAPSREAARRQKNLRDDFGLLSPGERFCLGAARRKKKTALAGGIASRCRLTILHRRRNQVAFVAMDVVLKRLLILRFDINLGLQRLFSLLLEGGLLVG